MGKRILVVDDEKLIVKGIRFSLEQDGYSVDCAYDGEEALKLAAFPPVTSVHKSVPICSFVPLNVTSSLIL